MLTVFQVGVDLENSQTVTSSPTGMDVRVLDTPKSGESVKQRDWPQGFRVFDPEYPRANFFSLHRNFLLMDEFARGCFGRLLEDPGEVLKFPLGGDEAIYLFNPLTTLDESAVDWSSTRGRPSDFYNLTLRKGQVPTNSVFRIAKIGGLFCSSELRDEDADFFIIYNKNALTGLRFKRLWDEHSGPVPNRSTSSDPQ